MTFLSMFGLEPQVNLALFSISIHNKPSPEATKAVQTLLREIVFCEEVRSVLKDSHTVFQDYAIALETALSFCQHSERRADWVAALKSKALSSLDVRLKPLAPENAREFELLYRLNQISTEDTRIPPDYRAAFNALHGRTAAFVEQRDQLFRERAQLTKYLDNTDAARELLLPVATAVERASGAAAVACDYAMLAVGEVHEHILQSLRRTLPEGVVTMVHL